MVEVVQRDDEPDVVLLDERRERRDVLGIRDERDDRLPVGVVEGRSERVGVDGERDRTGGAERVDDVDAQACAREEDDGHGSREYSARTRRPEDSEGAPIT